MFGLKTGGWGSDLPKTRTISPRAKERAKFQGNQEGGKEGGLSKSRPADQGQEQKLTAGGNRVQKISQNNVEKARLLQWFERALSPACSEEYDFDRECKMRTKKKTKPKKKKKQKKHKNRKTNTHPPKQKNKKTKKAGTLGQHRIPEVGSPSGVVGRGEEAEPKKFRKKKTGEGGEN